MELIFSDHYPHVKAIAMNENEWIPAFRISFDEALDGGFVDLAADLLEDAAPKINDKEYHECFERLLLAKQEDIREHE